jgi:hypothetical protein
MRSLARNGKISRMQKTRSTNIVITAVLGSTPKMCVLFVIFGRRLSCFLLWEVMPSSIWQNTEILLKSTLYVAAVLHQALQHNNIVVIFGHFWLFYLSMQFHNIFKITNCQKIQTQLTKWKKGSDWGTQNGLWFVEKSTSDRVTTRMQGMRGLSVQHGRHITAKCFLSTSNLFLW